MSHELRTPLNSVNALSRVLISQAGERLSLEENGYLEIIERNGKHLLSLINDILDLSKIEAGKMDLHLTQFALTETIDSVVENLLPLAREKGIALETKLPESLPLIQSDEAKVHQILENIIANAVKYTEKGGVCISGLQHRNHFDIKVEDTGIGISTKDLSTVFEEFRQADGTTTRKFEGTGLGLSIAYKAAQLLGGDVKVSSVTGQGSVFTVQIPISCDSAVPESPSVAAEPGLTIPPPDRQSDTILIVDDDPEMCGLLAHALQEAGYPTLTAATGREALELAETRHPLAITLDVIMPDMDGWEVLVRLKENPDTAPIPVVIISVTDEIDTGSALGAVGYITKPVDYQKLIRKIKKIHNILPATVMLVDDNEIDRNQAALCISQAGMRVMAADSGRQCLEMLEANRPDVMVLDLVMPGMDGLEAAQHISQLDEPPAIIFTTAYDEYALEAFKANAVDYLLKPVRELTLKTAIEKACSLNKAQLETVRSQHEGRTNITAKISGNIKLIPVKDIIYFQAEQKYVTVKYLDGETIIEDTLKELQNEFSETFVRIHRNAIVSKKFITGIHRDNQGHSYVMLGEEQKQLEISRRHLAEIKKLMSEL